ncbi:hypothetical protein V8C42DRAFT_117414 [Trichoderma barbatum]
MSGKQVRVAKVAKQANRTVLSMREVPFYTQTAGSRHVSALESFRKKNRTILSSSHECFPSKSRYYVCQCKQPPRQCRHTHLQGPTPRPQRRMGGAAGGALAIARDKPKPPCAKGAGRPSIRSANVLGCYSFQLKVACLCKLRRPGGKQKGEKLRTRLEYPSTMVCTRARCIILDGRRQICAYRANMGKGGMDIRSNNPTWHAPESR